MTLRAPIRWERRMNDDLFGWRGSHIIAMIFRPMGAATTDQRSWKITGVHMKWVAKGQGEAPSETAARRAADRAWDKWCEETGLRDDGTGERL